MAKLLDEFTLPSSASTIEVLNNSRNGRSSYALVTLWVELPGIEQLDMVMLSTSISIGSDAHGVVSVYALWHTQMPPARRQWNKTQQTGVQV